MNISPQKQLIALLTILALAVNSFGEDKEKHDMGSEFQSYVELAPFEVVDEALSISVFARSKSDRRYAVKFAEEVVDISYETIGKSTGYGLVIVGSKGEPHPMLFFQKFIQMAE